MQNQSSINFAGMKFRNIGRALLAIFVVTLAYYILSLSTDKRSVREMETLLEFGKMLSIFSMIMSTYIIRSMIKAGNYLINYSNNITLLESSNLVDVNSNEKTVAAHTSIFLKYFYEKTIVAFAFIKRDNNIFNIVQVILLFGIGFLFQEKFLNLRIFSEGISNLIPDLCYILFITFLSYRYINLFTTNYTLANIKKFALRYILSFVFYFFLYLLIFTNGLFQLFQLVSYEIINYFVTLLLLIRVGVNIKGYLTKE